MSLSDEDLAFLIKIGQVDKPATTPPVSQPAPAPEPTPVSDPKDEAK